MSAKTPQEILCMRCGAKPGVMCRTRSGNRAQYWHGRRNDDWCAITGRDIYGELKKNPPGQREARRELAEVDARLIANRSENEALRAPWAPLALAEADSQGLVPDSFWEDSAKLAQERRSLLSRQYDLRGDADLNPMTGDPRTPAQRARISQDEEGGGWYPDLLGPTEDVRGWCRGPITEELPSRRGIHHAHCEDKRRHHLRLEHDGEVVSGITLRAKKPWRGMQSAAIDRVFTSREHRRHGHARELLDYARREFRSIKHSRDLTDQGRAWRWAVRNPPRKLIKTIGKHPEHGDDSAFWRWHDPVYANRFYADKGVRGYNVFDLATGDGAFADTLRACSIWIESSIRDDPEPWDGLQRRIGRNPNDDRERFLASIPLQHRNWIAELSLDQQHYELNRWYWWWVNTGQHRRGPGQGQLYGETLPPWVSA